MTETDAQREEKNMSQKKVDRYKEEKAHRKERIAKEKHRQKVTRIVLWAVLAVFLVWIAYSVYRNVRPEPSVQETVPTETETAAPTAETQETQVAETTETAETQGTEVTQTAAETQTAESTAEESYAAETASEQTDSEED